jgi:hypothetical protein
VVRVSSSDLDDTSATGLFNFAAGRVNAGWDLGKFLKTGVGLTIVGMFVGIQNLVNSIINLVTNPLDSAGESVATLFSGIVGAPAAILEGTAGTTAAEISATFTGFLGPLAFPVGVASVMAGLYLVSIYLEERNTSDIFPGLFTDIDTPEWVPFLPDPGVQEEGETDDARD